MLVGGAVYDPIFMGHLLGFFGANVHLTQSTTLRFPIYLNLITALLTLVTALGLREPAVRTKTVAPGSTESGNPEITAWSLVVNAGRWIVQTPVALFVILAGVLLDSVVRLFLTFSSSYFRIIDLPEATFGVIGAVMGGLGMVVSPVARRMVAVNSVARNYGLIATTVLIGLIGVACRWPYWGVLFMLPLMGAMMALGYCVSYYLNAIVDSSHRATVLSFKGVIFNLGYGFISLVFALVLRAVRDGGSTQDAIARSMVFLPVWVLFGGLACVCAFWKQRRSLTSVISLAAKDESR